MEKWLEAGNILSFVALALTFFSMLKTAQREMGRLSAMLEFHDKRLTAIEQAMDAKLAQFESIFVTLMTDLMKGKN